MADFDTRSKDYNLIINKPVNYLGSTEQLRNSLADFFQNGYCEEYALIVHNQDTNPDGTLKREHIHAVIKTKKIKRCKTVINDINSGLNIPDNCISIEICSSVSKSCRYLLHLDDLDKYQYSLKAVVTNDSTRFEDYINFCDNTSLSVQKIIDYCWTSDNLLEVYTKIGLVNSQRNLALINAIWRQIYEELVLGLPPKLRRTSDNSEKKVYSKDLPI